MIQVLTIVIIGILIIALAMGFSLLMNRKPERYDEMSIKESIDLAGLPIITFINGENKFNFLVDSGATDSLLTESAFKKVKNATQLPIKGKLLGINGTYTETKMWRVPVEYKGKIYSGVFQVFGDVTAFDDIRKESGVTIHGILGMDFLDTYDYVLDFKEYVIYSKKKK